MHIVLSPKLMILIGLFGGFLAFSRVSYFLVRWALIKESVGLFGWLFKGGKILFSLFSFWLTYRIGELVLIQAKQLMLFYFLTRG
jgi:hypothetical protein